MERETITMTARDQQRAYVLTRHIAGELDIGEAAALMGLSVRQSVRLRAAFLARGPAALVHGNRGRPSNRRTDEGLRSRVVELAQTRYEGANDCHLTELLAEREAITLSRVTVRRILRTAGIVTPRRRRPARHRRRRERMPQEGLLLQLDGSRHDWLEGRGPWLTLLGAVDDATGRITAATFRDQEDTAGYFEILRATIRRHGLPAALYHDHHGAFEAHDPKPVAELRLADARTPTQLGRALAELGIGSIAAGSPQAKGRVERIWGTFQDRLVTELRLAAAADRESANRILARFLARYNRRFAVPAADPEPAWRPLTPEIELDAVLAFRYRRVVAHDHTVRIGGIVLDLPPGPGGRGYAGRRVEVSLRLDGRLVVSDAGRRLLIRRTALDPSRLRGLEAAPAVLRVAGPSLRPVPPYRPGPAHPWRRATPGSQLEKIRRQEGRLTDSVIS
jgi:transposase